MNQDSLEQFHQRLGKYIPSEAAPMVAEVMIGHDAFLRLTKNRHSKHGDYRAPFNGKGHIITINSTLNKYAFLLTLLHEFAHMTTWKKYGRNASPHGKEWKKEFSIITSPFIQKNIFPGELKTAISKYFLNPKASSCTDHNLQEALMKFDDQYEETDLLIDLPEGELFKIYNGKIFRKGKRLRKNFECTELNTKKKYRVAPYLSIQKILP